MRGLTKTSPLIFAGCVRVDLLIDEKNSVPMKIRPPVLRAYFDDSNVDLSPDPNRPVRVNLFAGGGGASLGELMATGRSPDIAINHSPVAIAMHRANHPTTRHFIEDV